MWYIVDMHYNIMYMYVYLVTLSLDQLVHQKLTGNMYLDQNKTHNLKEREKDTCIVYATIVIIIISRN